MALGDNMQPELHSYLVARAGIEPATFRFSVEHSRHAATIAKHVVLVPDSSDDTFRRIP